LRIERIAQTIAYEVDRQDREGDRHASGEGDSGRLQEVIAAFGQNGPQLGVGGWLPRPRKLSVDSATIAVAANLWRVSRRAALGPHSDIASKKSSEPAT
jgi:hypothetical protein